jgi:hypothetical protein
VQGNGTGSASGVDWDQVLRCVHLPPI